MKSHIIGATGSKELSHNDLEALGDDIPDVRFNCPHYQYCNVKNFGRINCITQNTIETCTTWKFYNKYGDGGNHLGI